MGCGQSSAVREQIAQNHQIEQQLDAEKQAYLGISKLLLLGNYLHNRRFYDLIFIK